MEKIIITANPKTMRAFRLVPGFVKDHFEFDVAEIELTTETTTLRQCQDLDHRLEEMARYINELITSEKPESWVIASPLSTLVRLFPLLTRSVKERLDDIMIGDLNGLPANQIANRSSHLHGWPSELPMSCSAVATQKVFPSSSSSQIRKFDVMARFKPSGSSYAKKDFRRLDKKMSGSSPYDTLYIEVSSLDEGITLTEWIDTCVRYGHTGWEKFLVSSSDSEILAQVHALHPALQTGLILNPIEDVTNLDSLLEILHPLRHYCVLPSFDSLSEALFASGYYPDLKVFVRLNDSASEAISAFERGADGVVTDYPNRIGAAFAASRYRSAADFSPAGRTHRLREGHLSPEDPEMPAYK